MLTVVNLKIRIDVYTIIFSSQIFISKEAKSNACLLSPTPNVFLSVQVYKIK